MRRRWFPGVLAASVVFCSGYTLWAQGRSVSVKYLRAALGSIADRSEMSVTADYSGLVGMKEARGPKLRNKGFSQFSIVDPESGLVFAEVYCEQESSVFNELLGVKGKKRFRFRGYKGQGEGRTDAFFVTSLAPVREPGPAVPEEDEPRTYKVTIVDNVTSNRVMMMNVELGKPFNMMGSTLVIEEEERDEDRVRILK